MEKPLQNEKVIEIEPRGSYFEIDKDGYVINPASLEKIQPEWKPVIDDIIGIYKELYGEKLKQVYVRGSVAKGEAIKYISDIDTFAYVDETAEFLKEHSTNRETRKHLEEKYNFIEGIEMMADPLSEIPNDYIILNQSICVYGTPLEVPKFKPGKQMVIHAPALHKRMKWFDEFLEKENDPQEIKQSCTWIMKGILRAGFEITMERSQRYTRDLYRCYETFAEYYPEKESEMREVLFYALNPTSDKEKIRDVLEGISDWLVLEIPKYFEVRQ